MNSGNASNKGDCNPPVAGAASKRPSEDSGDSPREKRRASTTASAEDVSLTDEYGRSPLHLAAKEGDVARVRELLGRGADTQLRDRVGMTPIHWALGFEREAAAELLAGADCGNDLPDNAGYTPLHLAAVAGYRGTVTALVRSGTNPHVKNGWDECPLELALRRGGPDDVPKIILSAYAFEGIAIDWEELEIGEEERQFCVEELSRCEAEIRLMELMRVPGSSINHHHLVTRHVGRVASRLQRESAQAVARSDRARRDFPVYADLIASRLQMAEERRVRMDRCLECFSLLSPPLPATCADVVLLCLGDGDMGNFVRAFRP